MQIKWNINPSNLSAVHRLGNFFQFTQTAMSELIIPGANEGMIGYDMGSVIHGEGAVTNLDFHR